MNITLVWTLGCLIAVAGQTPNQATGPASALVGPVKPAPEKPVPVPVGPVAPEKLTDAEKIARLQRSIQQAEKEIDDLKKQLDSPESEYARAQIWFQKNEGLLNDKKKEIQQAKLQGPSLEATKLEEELADIQGRWARSRDRFNLAISDRKTMQEKLTLLPQRIEYDKQTLAKLLSPTPTKPSSSGMVPIFGMFKEANNGPQNATGNARPATGVSQATGPAQTTAEPATGTAQATGSASEAAAEQGKPVNKKLLKARTDAQAKEGEAKDANQRAQELSARLEALKRNVELEQRLLDSALKKSDQLQRAREALEKEQQRKLAARAPEAELTQVAETIQKIGVRMGENQQEIRNITERLAILQEEMTGLQSEQLAALEEAELKKREAEAAQKVVSELQNPFAIRNILQWLFDHGGKILAILFGMIVFHVIVRIGSRRIVQFILCSTHRNERESENRAQTLASVFRHAAGLLIFGGGTLMLLDTVGIPIVPLMGGAAVVGLAVAFGAQNLIKDYFSGFMLLMEDQYGLNDCVRIGETVGIVERVTLRITVLRDSEGTVHFVPHGTINTVSNLTHGWARSMVVVSVAYKENADRVMDVVRELGKELRADPNFGPHILEDLEMLGVDALDDSGVSLKFLIKTKAHKQWLVKREMLRRVKQRFDQLGIEIPFPHRTVFHRFEEAGEMGQKIEQQFRRAA